MPTKRAKTRQKQRQWYSQNAEQVQIKASQNYAEKKNIKNSRRKAVIQSDKSLQKHNKKCSSARAKKLKDEVVYQETNKVRAATRERTKLQESEEYRR